MDARIPESPVSKGFLPQRDPGGAFPAEFAKSQVLFNLHRAAASAEQTVIVVEVFSTVSKCIKPATAP